MNIQKPTYEELENKIKILESELCLEKEKNKLWNEEKYQYYIENAPDGIFLSDLNGNIIDLNNTFANYFGFTKEELLKSHISQLLLPEEWAKIKNDFQYIHINRKYSNEYTFLRKNNSTFYGLLSSVKISDSQFLVFLKNIDDMKFALNELLKAKEEAEENEEQFRLVFEKSNDAILWADTATGLIVRVNNAALNLFERTETELLGHHHTILHPLENKKKHAEDFKEHIRTKGIIPSETEIITKSGFIKYVEVSATIFKIGNREFNQGIFKDITDRKLNETALLKSEAQFRLVFEKSNDAILWADTTTGILVKVNQAAQNMFERTEKELVGQSQTILHPADKIEKYVQMFREHVNSNGVELMESEIITKSGKVKYVEVSSTIIKIGNREINQGIFKDITKRKLNETALLKNEAQFRNLFEKANDGIMYLSPKADIVGINESFAKMHGYTIEEMQQIKLQDLDVEDLSEIVPERMRKLASGEDLKFEVQHYHKNGSIVDFEVSTYKFSLNNEDYFVAFHRDISERKKIKKALDESRQTYKSLFDQNIDGVYSFDLVGNFTSANEALAKMADCTIEELLKITFVPLVTPEEREKVIGHFMNAVKGEPQNYDTCVMTVKGFRFYVNITNFPIIVNNKIIGVYGIAKDITVRINAEKALRESENSLRQLNLEKDKFLSILAHDLKNPFFALMGMSELLIKNHSKYSLDKIEKFSRSIYESAKNTYALLENLLEWSQSQSGKLECKPCKLDLRNILTNVIELLRPGADIKNISIEMKLLRPTYIIADDYMLNTILRNLISNAIKFTQKDGQITLNVEKKKNFAQITVSDNGVGIEKKIIDKLFNIDFNTSNTGTEGETGTGLGLILCKDFIEKQGGEIFVESVEKEGTTFHLTIPLYTSIDENKTNDESENLSLNFKNTVLVAEDDDLIFLYIEDVLTSIGIRTIHAKNGKEAVKIVMHDSSINLVLMDIKMPVMNGCKATIEIKKIYPDLPIIAQTAYALSSDKEKIIQCGCDNYITKPINHTLLLNIVNKYLNVWR